MKTSPGTLVTEDAIDAIARQLLEVCSDNNEYMTRGLLASELLSYGAIKRGTREERSDRSVRAASRSIERFRRAGLIRQTGKGWTTRGTHVVQARVPQLAPPGPNAREHHMVRARRVKRERRDVDIVLSQFTPPALPVVVTMIRSAPRLLDDDNAVGSMKSARDQIAAWLGVNDRDERVTWIVDQRKVPRKEQGTVLRVERRT